jgi:hypothetical protein
MPAYALWLLAAFDPMYMLLDPWFGSAGGKPGGTTPAFRIGLTKHCLKE